MLPLLVADQVRQTLLDYLKTTFRLRDHELERALFEFLQHPEHGLFHGPYVDVRLPFRSATPDEQIPLDIRGKHAPYAHQLAAWRRLTSADDHRPAPTLVTTGTGSGKTECFLYPLLDHCAREYAAGRKHGVKAIILYPMNALASDQAERIAKELFNDPRLKGKVRAGLYVGGQTQAAKKVGGPTWLIDDRDTLRQSPPDILLTNYRMLDFLLMRPEDGKLWRHNEPDTLQYLVLDELHTYDGAQGSDVACLIRRLRTRLQTPAEHLCCVGTSATIGSGGDEAGDLLLKFASDVFGTPFSPPCIIGESRQSIEEAFPVDDVREDFPAVPLPSTGVDPLEPAPDADAQTFLDAQAQIWLRHDARDPKRVAASLRVHDFLRVVLRALASGRRPGPRTVAEICAAIAEEEPGFAELGDRQPAALRSFLSLVSHARRDDGQPMLQVQVQYWIRELRHLVRRVDEGLAFDWRDQLPHDQLQHWLPMAYCRECGHSGLATIMREGEDRFLDDGAKIGDAWLHRRRVARFLETGAAVTPAPLPDGAAPEQQELAAYLCKRCLRYALGQVGCGASECPGTTIPARAHDNRSENKRFQHRCPRCHASDGLSMLGSRSASLSSVAISQLFLSPFNEDRKLLAFSDSVQDASHRAGFFAGRTYRFGMRTALQHTLDEADGPIALPEVADRLIALWEPRLGIRRFLATFMPPDLREHPHYEKVADVEPGKSLRAADHKRVMTLLRDRLSWEVTRELGLGVVVGRSLEATGSATVGLPTDEIQEIAASLTTAIEEERPVQLRGPLDPADVAHWLEGLLHRQRRRGGVHHPFLDRYAKIGRKFYLTKKAEPRLSRPGRTAPRFWLLGSHHQIFDPLYSKPNLASSPRDWTARALGLEARDGGINDILRRAITALAAAGIVRTVDMGKESSAGLAPEALTVTRDIGFVHCPRCGAESVLPASTVGRWAGRRCLTFRCEGTLRPNRADSQVPTSDYYRRLYRSGRIERIFAREHTGLLPRDEREEVEQRFKADGEARYPDAPNLLTCTPTLEMGIDIGDLSAVMLCSVPPLSANYLQRVGRAGRSTGNALVVTIANAQPHDQYFFAEPAEMMAGEVTPPGCFLDAPEMLMRQMAAYAMDRWAAQETNETNGIKPKTQMLLGKQGERAFPGCFYRYVEAHRGPLVDGFLSLFADHLSDHNADALRDFGLADGFVARVRDAFDAVRAERSQLKKQIDAIKARQVAIEADPSLAEGESKNPEERLAEELAELKGSIRGLVRLREELGNKYPLNVLTDAGALPNYAFPETGVTLKSILRGLTKQEKGEAAPTKKPDRAPKDATTYLRPASAALREFAPFNTFYAEGHKLRVSQIDLGTSQQPLTEWWRLCPSCNFATRVDPTAPPDKTCPACEHPGWEDDGQKRVMVHFRKALSVMNLLDAATDDSGDDREREQYKTLELIDARPEEHGKGGWLVETDNTTFGFELLTGISIREINFGLGSAIGTAKIAGTAAIPDGFKVCRHCGKVQDTRGSRTEHAPYCKVRSATATETWDHVYLYREMPSEALRLLLPVSGSHDLEAAVPSFRAGLQLGLRRRFHGYPQHLKITRTSEPVDSTGSARRQFLVIYDAVPGGTGYLGDLYRDGALFEVLQLALDAMRACRCRALGRDGCYRCVYAYQQQRDIGLVSRTRAENLFARILEDKTKAQAVVSLSDVSIDHVLESELEERFVQALQRWVGERPGYTWEGDVIYERGRCWRITTPDRVWRLEPQVPVGPKDGVELSCRPDFILRAIGDDGIKPVAVFCDGFRFHACPEKDKGRIADDLDKRRALIDSGAFWVWTVTWKDVVESEDPGKANPVPTLFTKVDARQQHGTAEQIGHGRVGEAVTASCLQQLKLYIEDPDPAKWNATAIALGFGLLDLRTPASTAAVQGLRKALLSGVEMLEPGELDKAAEAPTLFSGYRHQPWAQLMVEIDVGSLKRRQVGQIEAHLRLFDDHADRRSSAFEDSWRAFFQAYNLLQFHPERFDVLCTEQLLEDEATVVPQVPEPRRRATRETPKIVEDETSELSADLRELWEEYEEARSLVRALHEAGLPAPEEFEPFEGTAIDVEALLSWPEWKIAVAAEVGEDDARVWERHGWQAFVVDDVVETVAALSRAKVDTQGS